MFIFYFLFFYYKSICSKKKNRACPVKEANQASMVKRVNAEIRAQSVQKALQENKVNAVCKVSWVPLDLPASQLNEVILDHPDLPVKLVLWV